MKTNEWKGKRIQDIIEFMISYQIIHKTNPTGGSREGGREKWRSVLRRFQPLTYFNFETKNEKTRNNSTIRRKGKKKKERKSSIMCVYTCTSIKMRVTWVNIHFFPKLLSQQPFLSSTPTPGFTIFWIRAWISRYLSST